MVLVETVFTQVFFFYRWLIRCPPDYSIKLNVTNFQIEQNSDEILLYDATLSGNKLIGEITSLGEIETTSSELLVSFKSDCEFTKKGFQASVEFVKKSSEKSLDFNTTSTQKITEHTETTTATTKTTNHPTTAIVTTSYPTTATTLGPKYNYTEKNLDGRFLFFEKMTLK